ncbi:MAG: hypothetical protein FWG88_03760 [Oscillospiraceae bacterium]|nr:hypothetical protein [Oscillospiraceae bacterium]
MNASLRSDEKTNSVIKFDIADIVVSMNGRDATKLFLVIRTDPQYSWLVNGKGRKVEAPKKKKNKHLKFDGKLDGLLASKLIGGENVTNKEILRELTKYSATRSK